MTVAVRPRWLTKDLLRHSAVMFAATMTANFVNYLFNAAISRRVGVGGFAAVSSLTSLLIVFSIPTLIMALIVVKYAAAFQAADDEPRLSRLAFNVLKGTSLLAAIAFAAGFLGRNALAAFLRIDQAMPVLLSLGIMSIGTITPVARAVLQGEQDFARYAISLVLENALKAAFGIALVFAGFGVEGAMCGWLCGAVCAAVYTAGALLRKRGKQQVVRLAITPRHLLQTTFGVGAATVLLTLMTYVDVLIVKHYFSAIDSGLYAGVNLTGKTVFLLAAFVPPVLLPKVVARHAENDGGLPLLIQGLGITAVVSGTALLLFGHFPTQILTILAGHAFAGGAPYVLQYDAAMCLLAILSVVVNYRIARHSFGFIVPLAAIFACEIAAMAFFHGSLWNIVHILELGNAGAICCCLFGLKPLSLSVD